MGELRLNKDRLVQRLAEDASQELRRGGERGARRVADYLGAV